MYNKKSKPIAIIPARSGSKRIPNKNIKIFHGKPIIGYSIEAAKKSNIFSKVIVSTNDDNIGRIAQSFGADYLFKRPNNLSNNFSTIKEVIKHAINWLEENALSAEIICCIYATAPMIDVKDLLKSYNIIKRKNCDYVLSAFRNSQPIQRSFFLDKKKKIHLVNKKNFLKRSQDLTTTFSDAAHFCWGRREAWEKKIPFSGNSQLFLIPFLRTKDIDTKEDWKDAERLFHLMKKK